MQSRPTKRSQRPRQEMAHLRAESDRGHSIVSARGRLLPGPARFAFQPGMRTFLRFWAPQSIASRLRPVGEGRAQSLDGPEHRAEAPSRRVVLFAGDSCVGVLQCVASVGIEPASCPKLTDSASCLCENCEYPCAASVLQTVGPNCHFLSPIDADLQRVIAA